MRVLVTNAYSAKNRGDAAIVQGMIGDLSRREPFCGAVFAVSSADFPAPPAHPGVEAVPSFHSLGARLPGGLARQLHFLSVAWPLSLLWIAVRRLARLRLPLPGGIGRLMREYDRADAVVAAGGGYLYTTSPRRGSVVLLRNLWSFAAPALLGRPVYLFAQSVGPFAAPWQARLVRRALRGVRLVCAREEGTMRLLEEWGAPAALTADAVFLLEGAQEGERAGGRGGAPSIGMTVRRWHRDRREHGRYLRAVAEFVDRVRRGRGATVTFLPQVTWAGGDDDDRRVAEEVCALLGDTRGVEILRDEMTPAGLMDVCRRLDFLVATRMHSALFALLEGVPALAVGYQPKTAGIMDRLGLGEFVVPLEGLDGAALAARFEALVASGDRVREILARRLPEMRRLAGDSGRLIADDYLRRAGRRP